MGTINTGTLVKEASAAIKDREDATKRAAALRELLRGLDAAGQLSEQESKWLAEAFPPRERKAKENGDESGDE